MADKPKNIYKPPAPKKPQFQNPQPDPEKNPSVQYFQNNFNTQIPPPQTPVNKLISFDTDLEGLFETVSVAPTNIPKSPYDQVKIYVNGSVKRLYWYDNVGHAWYYFPSSGLAGAKVYYVSDTSGGAVTRKLTFTDGILTAET